jgi:uncharacterized membrane protein
MRTLAQLRAFIETYRRRSHRRKRTASLALRTVWPLWLIAGFLVAIYGGAAWYGSTTRPKVPPRVETPNVALKEGQDLRISFNQLEPGRLYLFHYSETPNPQNRFVVQRASDGSLTVARATCRECYSSAHEHYVSDAGLVCGRCKHPMHSSAVHEKATKAAGCDLIPIPYELDGDHLVVKARDVVDQSTKEKS